MLTTEQQNALQQIAIAAVASERSTYFPAAVSAAQCIFESAWLTRCPGNNCFGIKVDGRGSGVQYCLTLEYLNGAWEKMPLAFETYDSLALCFADHARLITTLPTYAAAWKQYLADHDVDGFISRFAPIYATDPDYARKIGLEAGSETVRAAIVAAQGAR